MMPRPPEEPASPHILNRTDRRSVLKKFRNLFDWYRPLDGKHPRLYKGYLDEQCAEFDLEKLSLELGLGYAWERCANATQELLDCAAMIRGCVAVWLRLSKPSRISLDRDAYLPLGSRQHSGDPRDSYCRVKRAKERLVSHGFIGFVIGEKDLCKQTIIWPTNKALEWAEQLDDPTEIGAMMPREQSRIQFRNARKKPSDFPWTIEAARMEANLVMIEKVRELARIFLADGTPLPYAPYTRIFNRATDLSLGGRFYLPGTGNHQNMDHDKRRGLMWEIDGVLRPTDEVDVSCLHAVLAYREMGLPAPQGDLYDVRGYPRRLCKIAFQTMINAANNPSANGSIANLLLNNPELREGTGLRLIAWTPSYDRNLCKRYAWGLMRAIKATHAAIKKMFCSGAGLRFQRLESDWAERVMLAMIELTGLCPAYIYDSFRVPTRYKNLLRAVMKREALAVFGFNPTLNEDVHTSHIGLHSAPESSEAIDSVPSALSTSGPSGPSLGRTLYNVHLYGGKESDSTLVSTSLLPSHPHALPVSLIRTADRDRGPPYG